jgi:hypothetical protein
LTLAAQQSRVDALIRLVGLITLAFGMALVYFSYENATVAGIAPEIITVNYALGFLLIITGFVAAFAKFK